MSTNLPTLETIRLTLADKVATVSLNRPEKANAMNWQVWQDIRSAMQWADRTPEVRAVVLQGEGKHFTSGIDLTMMMGLQAQIKDDCDGRMREKLRWGDLVEDDLGLWLEPRRTVVYRRFDHSVGCARSRRR